MIYKSILSTSHYTNIHLNKLLALRIDTLDVGKSKKKMNLIGYDVKLTEISES